MSTKIYNAYKVPIDRLNDFIDYVRPRELRRIGNEIKTIIATYDQERLGEEPEWVEKAKEPQKARERWRRSRGYDILKHEARDLPSLYDHMASWLNIWFLKGSAYVICCGVTPPRWAKDYSYWNNTDRPEGVSAAAWTARKKRWDEINTGSVLGTNSHNARRLQHVIVEPKELGMNFELLVEIMGKEWLKANS